MNLVYKFNMPHSEVLDTMFRTSNNLYNQALYVFRQRLESDGAWLWYADLDKIMKTVLNLEGQCNYRMLKSQCSQQILRVLDRNIKAYCKAIKDWKAHPEKYRGMPKLPDFRKRGGMFNIYYTNQSCSIKDGKLRLSKDLFFNIPQWDKYKDRISNFCQCRLIPEPDSVKVEIIYETEVRPSALDSSRCASIDFGIDNLATMATPEGCEIFSGKFLKSYNVYFNKTLARLQSVKDMQGVKRITKRIRRMYDRRNRYIDDAFHKISRQIANTLVQQNVGTLAVGYNAGWKNNVCMGRKNNQKFVQIPFARLTSYLKYKCELSGITFVEHEESYTSKCDALALEPICKHEVYFGKRKKRGLFQSSVGKDVNADLNGAWNILRKVVGDSAFLQITDRGRSLRPVRHRSPF
jgi:IS605 OrfB family transposase